MSHLIEVEQRSFISAEKYQKLISQFETLYSSIEDTRQVTHYFDCPIDTRLQISTEGGRLWQKLGKMHDDAREEIEVTVEREEAVSLYTLFQNMGLSFKISWYRHRRAFQKNELTITVDHTVGYGYILEAEILCDDHEKDAAKTKLTEWFQEQGIEISPKQDFEKAFASYTQNWKELTGDLSLKWIDEKVTV
jgi:predicted adenylyl cyclase CyaB